MVIPILSLGLACELYQASVPSITSKTFSTGMNSATGYAACGFLPCLPPTYTALPTFSATRALDGHTLMQSPHDTHLSHILLGSSFSISSASEWQEGTHRPRL